MYIDPYTQIIPALIVILVVSCTGCNNKVDPISTEKTTELPRPVDFTFSEKAETLALVLADVNGDGHLDLLEGVAGGHNLLYINNQSLDPFRHVEPILIASENHMTIDLALEDIDGDGDLDYIECTLANNFLRINNGSKTHFDLLPSIRLTPESMPTYASAFGDINGDDRPDIVLGNSQGNLNQFILNDTQSPFLNSSHAKFLGVDKHVTEDLLLFDLDGDGHLDLLTANAGEPNRIYMSDGESPFFSKGRNIIDKPDYTFAIAAGDIDNDGDFDIICGNMGSNTLFLNEGGTFTPHPVGQDKETTRVVILEDFNGDGNLDLLTGNHQAPNLLFLNTGAEPFFVEATKLAKEPVNDATRAMAVGDVNGDGTLDIVVGNASSQANRIYFLPTEWSSDPFPGYRPNR